MLRILVRFFTLLSPMLQRLGICATAGFIAGSFTGFILWVYAFFNGAPVLATPDLIKLSLMIAFFAWVLLIFTFVVLGNMPFLSIWYSTLMNALLTCFFTVLVVYKFDLWVIAWLVGMIVGIWIGLLLCYINNLLKNKRNGVHQ
jgi:hypothetical protein